MPPKPACEMDWNDPAYLEFRNRIVEMWRRREINRDTLVHGVRTALARGTESDAQMIYLLTHEPRLPKGMSAVLQRLNTPGYHG